MWNFKVLNVSEKEIKIPIQQVKTYVIKKKCILRPNMKPGNIIIIKSLLGKIRIRPVVMLSTLKMHFLRNMRNNNFSHQQSFSHFLWRSLDLCSWITWITKSAYTQIWNCAHGKRIWLGCIQKECQQMCYVQRGKKTEKTSCLIIFTLKLFLNISIRMLASKRFRWLPKLSIMWKNTNYVLTESQMIRKSGFC